MMKSLKRTDALLMTPKIEAFLRRVPDGVIWDEAALELWRGLVTRAMGNEDRSGRFGASSRGTCHRRQVFTYLGMPQGRILDVEIQNLFNDGKWRHLRWQMMGMQSGALTHVEWPAVLSKYRVKVSMDGLNADEGWLFELKGDRNYSRVLNEDDHKHVLQIHTMLIATGYDVASYVIEDKSSQQFREIVIRRDPKIIEEVRVELEELNEYVEGHRLPDILPACASKAGPYRTCPYASQCIERHNDVGNQWPDRAGDWDS